MGQATLHVGQPGEKDRLGLMMMIRLENELVPRFIRPPGLRRLAEFQKLVQSLRRIRRLQHGLLQVRRPVHFRGPNQQIRRRESDVVIDQIEKRRAQPEVCRIFCATANPTEVILAETEQGRAILGVVDGFSPKGVEDEGEIKWRKEFLRKIGYKL